MSEIAKTPRQLIREALLHAWKCDSAAVRTGALETIGDELFAALSVPRGNAVAWVLWDEEGVIDSTFDKDSAEKWEKESSQIMRVRPLVFGDVCPYENQSGPTWRPMNTAPLDNRRPLVIATFEEDGSIRDIDFDAVWTSESESWEMPEVYWFWASAHGRIEDPTHWTYQDEPLPRLFIPVTEVASDVV